MSLITYEYLEGIIKNEYLPSEELAIEMAKLLIEKFNNNWISCDERLPEQDDEHVLVYFKGGDITCLYFSDGQWEDGYGEVPIRQDVTHWMPLPSSPQTNKEVILPKEPTPAMLYALWAHWDDMRGLSENTIAKVSYLRLYNLLKGTGEPQNKWHKAPE